MDTDTPLPKHARDVAERAQPGGDNTLEQCYQALGQHLQRLLLSPCGSHGIPSQQLLSIACGIIKACGNSYPEADPHHESNTGTPLIASQLQEQMLAMITAGSATAPSEPGSLAVPTLEHCPPPNPNATACTQPNPVATTVQSVNATPPITMDIYCLGQFRTFINDRLVVSWPGSKAKSVLKNLIAHRDSSRSKEMLMEVFWPHATPQAARNNLNVAIHSARKALTQMYPGYSFIKFAEGCYYLNTDLAIWVDAEAFSAHRDRARQHSTRGNLYAAMAEYRSAEA